MPYDGHEIHVELPHVHGDFPHGLSRVGVEYHGEEAVLEPLGVGDGELCADLDNGL